MVTEKVLNQELARMKKAGTNLTLTQLLAVEDMRAQFRAGSMIAMEYGRWQPFAQPPVPEASYADKRTAFEAKWLAPTPLAA